MAARKRISEVSLTTTGIEHSETMSLRCPHDSGSSLENTWFEYLLTEVLKSKSGGKFKLPLNVAGTEYILVDRGLISSITITLS